MESESDLPLILPGYLPDSPHIGCKLDCCWPRTQAMLLKWQCYGYQCTHWCLLWTPSTTLHCVWCVHVSLGCGTVCTRWRFT